MNIFDKLKVAFKNGDALIRLIFINAGVFIIYQAIIIAFKLFNLPEYSVDKFLALPADLHTLMYYPWTIISYMFMHEGIFHILFNMVALYWFGKLFLMAFSQRQLVGLYLTGGIISGITYIAAYNLFPYFQNELQGTILMGASGSIMAIILATAIHMPNMELGLLFLGKIKLKYIALFYVLISFFGVTSNNAGGEIAHLGGALCGYFFIVSLRKGNDLTKPMNRIVDFFSNLFKPRRLKVKKKKYHTSRKMTDEEFNMKKARDMKEVDRILDKIKTSGYDCLTDAEKKKLFEQSKK